MCYETMRKLLWSLKEMGVKAINWTGGGEPLVNKKTIDAIVLARLMGFDQGIFTNGLLLKKEVADLMAPRMTWVRFSVDGYDEESYAHSHGTSEKSFNIVISNLKYLCSIKKRCTVGVGFVMTEENYSGAGELARIAKQSGADYIQFKPVGMRKGTPQVKPEVIKSMFDHAMRVKDMYEDDNFSVVVTKYRFDDLMDEDNNYGRFYSKCHSHHFQGAVGADSKVYLCDHHKGEKEYELGDLNENTLEEIWKSDKRKEVIRRLDETDLSQCMDCCRNHELNKFLWQINNPKRELHPNHI